MVIPSHYWTGPLAALVVLGIVVLIMRWVFAPPTRPVRRVERADYGLLVPVASTRTAEDAVRLREVLRAAGIRATVGDDGQLLVFREDAGRASDLVHG